MFVWPQDSQEVQQYVQVDFAADPRILAKQTAEKFDVVLPIGPDFPIRDRWQVAHILQTIRERVTQ